MTNYEKNQLRQLAKEGYSFQEIQRIVFCSDATIKNYLKIFTKKRKK
jgi:DNA-binding CsgD family transcriptional regulator